MDMPNSLTLACGLLAAAFAAAAAGDLPLVPYPASVKATGGESRGAPVSCVRDASIKPEGYRLSVCSGAVEIRSADAAGELYARKTLGQLRRADGSYPCVEVEDAPKFPWRGLHFDDARHFFGRAAVLKTIETMAEFKLNVLHWHLVDNEGWRLPVPGYPQLTNAVRGVENRLNFRDASAEGTYGPFAYTKDELREIVARAAALNIRIVPELEIPGHSKALLAACPQLRCETPEGGKPVDNVACVGSDETIRFFERALDEVMDIFPDSVIHIGGDECNRRGWKACPLCRKRMKKEKIADVAGLQAWTTTHFERYLAARGRWLMGWDEIAEGGLPSGAMVMSWRGTATGIAAAKRGHDVVMTPTEYCYFDYPQCIANDPEKYPFNWTLLLPAAKVYAFDPLKGIPAEFHGHVLGAQANNWSEMTVCGRELEWKVWPRAAVLAEVLWSYPEKRDFAALAGRLEVRRADLVSRGVNAAPVAVHADPGGKVGRLSRSKTASGESFSYSCGATSAKLTLEDGVLTLERTGAEKRVFQRDKRPFFEMEALDVGAGATLVTAHRKDTELCVTVLFDGERVLAKDRYDFRSEPAPLDDAVRPYEFVWANRTADEFPSVARLEKADGWTVGCENAEARFTTATNRAFFGRSVARLAYRSRGENAVVRLRPPRPVPLPDAFDTVTLWVYGNNIRGKPCPSVSIAAEFADDAGKAVRRPLGSVWHRGWHMLNGVGAAPYGLRFTGFEVKGLGGDSEWRELDLTSLCAYVDPKRPDTPPPRAKRGVQVFADCPQGLNTGEGRLPFPNRPETVMPPPASLRRKLEFRLPEDPLDWCGLAFRYGDSDWIPLAAGGGLFPRAAAKGARVSFRQEGNSLVCEVARPEPGVETVRFGAVQFPGKAETFGWPYYTYRYFNKWDNPLLPADVRDDGPCFYRPRVAAAQVGGATLFVAATMDWTQSNASGPICLGDAAEGATQLNIGTVYLPKTDGRRNGCFERFVWTFSEDVADVFPSIPNPKSPYMKETGSSSWVSFHAGKDREKDIAYWRAVKGAGLGHVIITDHEVGWRDGNESFTFRTRAAPGKGGDEGQRRYARVLIDELGFRYGPYNNFTDYAPVNGFWSIDHVARRGDWAFLPAWHRCYAPKATWGVGMCESLAPEIQGKFSFNTAYCDVHTCVTPWQRVDYDARSPGAGTFAQVFYCFGEIMLLQKAAWKGPVYSEGAIHWMFSGLTDGNYAQDGLYDFMKEPWLVDFDLRRMHPLCCNFGMGAPDMFYGEEKNAEMRKADPQSWIDRFTAATLAFGHPGFFICRRNPGDLSVEKESYYPVQAIAALYTQAEAEEVLYADAAGALHATSAALANGAAKRSQLKVRYSDGTVVAVNGNLKENFRVEVGGVMYDLPPNGWRAESADKAVVSFNGIENGVRVKYARSPEYDWRKEHD